MNDVITLAIVDKTNRYGIGIDTDRIDVYHTLARHGVTWYDPWDTEQAFINGECDDIFELAEQLADEGFDDIVVTNDLGEPVNEDGHTQRELDEMAEQETREAIAFRDMMYRWIA